MSFSGVLLRLLLDNRSETLVQPSALAVIADVDVEGNCSLYKGPSGPEQASYGAEQAGGDVKCAYAGC